MVTTPPHGLDLVIHKANLWDNRPNQPPLAPNWSWDIREEERYTSMVSGCGVIGLSQRGSELFEAARNTARLPGRGAAWIALNATAPARRGDEAESLKFLVDVIERFQSYSQGCFAEISEPRERSGNRFDMSTPYRLVSGKRAERDRLPGGWFDFPVLELGPDDDHSERDTDADP